MSYEDLPPAVTVNNVTVDRINFVDMLKGLLKHIKNGKLKTPPYDKIDPGALLAIKILRVTTGWSVIQAQHFVEALIEDMQE